MKKFSHKQKALVGLGLAVALSLATTVDATFAQGGFHRDLVLPDVVAPETTPAAPASANLTAVVAVNARVMSLVSLAARQVALAKTSDGAKQVAKEIIATSYPKWNASQVSCLNQLWNAESHWNYKSRNKRSGAAGIAQAMPASKMNSIATDWEVNPLTQIKWGLNYISSRYHTPCNALAHHHRTNSY